MYILRDKAYAVVYILIYYYNVAMIRTNTTPKDLKIVTMWPALF